MNRNSKDEIYSLFARYLSTKIKKGIFPQGNALPSPSEFMMIFRLSLSDIIKAFVFLERKGLVQAIGNAQIVVIGGCVATKAGAFDVRKDVNELFSELEILELNALDNAWTRIDRGAIRQPFKQSMDLSPTQRIWQMNLEINKQIIENCCDEELRLRLASIQEEIEFFRCLYLENIPQNEVLAHAVSIEAIVRAILLCKAEDAHFHISTYIGHIQEKLLDVFKENYLLSCRKADEMPVGLETRSHRPTEQTSFNKGMVHELKGDTAMQSKEAKNLKKLAKTAMIMNFVKSKNGNWNHQDWLQFLSDIKRRGYDPIDADQVGLMLEEKKAQYLAASNSALQ